VGVSAETTQVGRCRAIVSTHLPADLVVADATDHGRWRFRTGLETIEDGGSAVLVPPSPWLTVLAFGVVAVPFVVALGILITQSDRI
jgi:hypothetical protein